MLKGDLVSTPLPAVLRQLADGVASGCLHVNDGVGDPAKMYLRGGQVYAVQVPGRRPQLGARLVSSGSLGPEALSEALEAQRTELQGWRLGELLVHLGYVDQPVVEAFIHEQVREQTSDLLRWPTGTWKFRVNERTREDVAPPTPVEDLLEEVARRQAEWDAITEVLHGPDAVPMLSAAGQSDAEMAIDPEAWSLLCKVDGVRSITELARECGFTLYEAGQVVFGLVRSGLLEVEEVLVGAEENPAPTGSVSERLFAAFAPDGGPAPAATAEGRIPTQAEEPTPADVASLVSKALREDRNAAALAPQKEDQVEGSLERLSHSLSAVLGTTTDESLFDAPKPRVKKAKPLTPVEQERATKKAERATRDAKRRENDAAELAAAQAEIEAARQADADASAAALVPGHEAEIVSLDDVRRERDEELEVAAAEAAEAEVAAAEAAALEAARLAEEAEAEVAAAEVAALEAARLAEEAEATRVAEDAEAARVAAEEAEAARVAAEEAEAARVAAEEAEAARVAAEYEAETARLAEEAEAARVAAELESEAARLAAEYEVEAARVAEEAEAARVAAECEAEAARVAEEAETARLAAEYEAEAARVAAEEAEHARVAAEEVEAARVAAELEAEAARVAAETEAARVAAEEAEHGRLAAEAVRVAEEAEAARVAEAAAALAAEQEAQLAAQLAAEELAHQRAQAEEELRVAVQEQAAAEAEAARVAEQAAAAAQASAAQEVANAEQEEQARLTAQRNSASSAFAELSATAASASDVQVLEHEADVEQEEPEPVYKASDTDMASLFRELSSLGMEDAPDPKPVRAPSGPPRPSTTTPAAKKKKGLFGR